MTGGEGAAPDRISCLESDDLHDVFGAFGLEDLDPIVTILNGATSLTLHTRLKERRTYKAHAPDHHRYIHQIVTEIRWWGSHDLVSAVRGRYSSYRGIVHDLCERAGVKTRTSDSAFDMERLLLKKAANEALGSMKPADHAKAAGILGGALAGAAPMAASFAGARLLSLVGGPVAIAAGLWTAWDLLGPGYRVTGPCVLAIAEARFRLWRAAVADSMGE